MIEDCISEIHEEIAILELAISLELDTGTRDKLIEELEELKKKI